ncbi:MAG: replication initiation protein [Arcobacteraceae bacterium]|nr:replication initiation protein [Arcobacteraceae bacterium]
MKNENIVIVKNDFIRGNFSTLNIRDMKILKLLISKVNSKNKSFNKYYSVSKDEVRAFYFNEKNLHHYIKTSLRKLATIFILIKDDKDQEVEVSLVGKIIYNKKTGIYKVPLSDDLQKYLLDIKSAFTQYNLLNLIHLTTKQELKLYEYIKSISFQVFSIHVDKLRYIMELHQKSYSNFYNFNHKLKVAINNINENTDINLSYRVLKTNGVSTSIKFSIKRFDSSIVIYKNQLEQTKQLYLNKTIVTSDGEMVIKDLYEDRSSICIKAYSEELNVIATLQFNDLEHCIKWTRYHSKEVL